METENINIAEVTNNGVYSYAKSWIGSKSQKFTTNKRHVYPFKTSEELNKDTHPLFSLGSRRHFP